MSRFDPGAVTVVYPGNVTPSEIWAELACIGRILKWRNNPYAPATDSSGYHRG